MHSSMLRRSAVHLILKHSIHLMLLNGDRAGAEQSARGATRGRVAARLTVPLKETCSAVFDSLLAQYLIFSSLRLVDAGEDDIQLGCRSWNRNISCLLNTSSRV